LDTLIEQGRAQEDLNPLVVLQLFRNIPDADCRVLDMDPLKGRPESLLLETLIVPPVCIRPSAPSKNEGKDDSTEDDLTAMLRGAPYL
jgi:DNA-directed RNA polymerase III subunit RPC1